MIQEFLLYFREKCSDEAKKFGHLKESIALLQREKRCHKYWSTHLDNCHQVILELTNKLKRKDLLIIMGSGPLHEIPIESLAHLFKKILLIDIVQLSSVKKKYSHLNNIHFIEHDISELEKEIKQTKILKNKIPISFVELKPDMVISANLLSQMPYHFKNFLQKNTTHQLESIEEFCYQLSADHFQYLKNFQCPVLIYTDIETHYKYVNENKIEIDSPYIKFALPEIYKQWDWDIAPAPEISREFSLQMKVASFILNF